MSYVVIATRRMFKARKLVCDCYGPFERHSQAEDYGARWRALWNDSGARFEVRSLYPPNDSVQTWPLPGDELDAIIRERAARTAEKAVEW